MLRSLRFRLILTTLIVLAVVVTALALISRRATVMQLDDFVEMDAGRRLDRAAEVLARHYRHSGSWTGVDSILASMRGLGGEPLLLVDRDGAPIASTVPDFEGADVEIGPGHELRMEWTGRGEGDHEQVRRFLMIKGGPHIVLTADGGVPVGTLYLTPMGMERDRKIMVGAVNRWLVLAVVAAGLLGITLTLALSRRILGPVEALTDAARRMETGDFSRRVDIRTGDEIGQLAHAFNAMADSVVNAETLRRNLVGDVAHELRTPLTNIRCQLEALQDGLARPDRAIIDSLHEETMLLSRLIEDLQEMALAEAGGLNLSPEALSVHSEIRKATSALEPRATAAGITLRTTVPEDIPAVRADARRLAQVLRNLLENSLTHTPEGGEVEATATALNGSVEITVRDTGRGIPAEHLPYVFERFYRVDVSRNRATGGSGLGLAIVKQLVLAQGGAIRVESEPGRGSRFTVTFPLAAGESTPFT
jgi:signal transduction histidine kinase